MSYRALTWPWLDRRELLMEKISLIFQSGKNESLLFLTLPPQSAGFPKGFVLYPEGNQTWMDLEIYFLWNLTHQICQIMFSEVNLRGQHHIKAQLLLTLEPTKRASRCQGCFASGKPHAQILPPATTRLCFRRVIAEVKHEGHFYSM